MGMMIPWLIKGGIDAILQQREDYTSLLRYPLLILGAALLQGIFRYLWRININGFSRRAESDLRSTVFAHLLKLPLSYFNYMKTGDLMSRLTSDVQAVRELLGFGSLAIVDCFVVISMSLSFMIAIDPWLTLWSLLALPLITVTVRVFGRQIFQWSREVQRQLSELSTYVQENLAGIRVVQAYAQEENRIRTFTDISSEYMRKNLWLATLWGVFWPLMQVVAGVAATVVLWLGGRRVLEGTMTLGEFVAFNGYLGMLTWPLMAVGHVVNQYQRGTAALSRIGEILDAKMAPGYLEDGRGVFAQPIRGRIEFRDLTFAYREGDAPVLRGVSLVIPEGTTCGVIGETGAGKSSLIHLLPRLFEPPRGAVFIDGVDVRQIPLGQLKDAIGLVSQDIFLFSGTLQENILFGLQQSRHESLEEAARIAQLLPTVQQFPSEFNTVLGERGVRLSGGQKQRTALARAIIKSPPILILDDAFSSVDTETEDEILRSLEKFMKGRTTLLVSHRVSTVQRADQILYMRDGEIIEQGTHEELLALRGAYYRVHRKQQLVRQVEGTGRTDERP
jgi:ATP-binding cassette, subfamily B, multidrug efflux pump